MHLGQSAAVAGAAIFAFVWLIHELAPEYAYPLRKLPETDRIDQTNKSGVLAQWIEQRITLQLS